MDAIKFLSRQHRRFETLFKRYQRWPARAPAQAKELLGLIERAIIPHAMLEEIHVYPLLRQRVPGGDIHAKNALDEHAEVERTLKQLEGMKPESVEFDTTMRRLIDSVEHHIHEEEEEPGLFAMLRQNLTQRELNDLGKQLELADDMVPTRPHPMAPDRPPANVLVGLPTAAIDRLRDRLSGRAERAEEMESEMRSRTRRASSRRRTSSRAKRAGSRNAASTRARGNAGARSRSNAKRGASRRRPTGAVKARARRTTRSKARRR